MILNVMSTKYPIRNLIKTHLAVMETLLSGRDVG